MNYIFCGKETFFIEKRFKKVIKDFFDGEDINLYTYDYLKDGIEPFLDELTQTSLGFFLKKAVVIKNSEFLVTEKERKKIKDGAFNLLKDVILEKNPNLLVIFISNNVVAKSNNIVKLVEENGKIYILNEVKKPEFIQYAKEYFKNMKYKINDDALNLLIKYVNYDFYSFHNEADKLMLYKIKEKEITLKDIDELSSRIISDNFFDLANAIVSKNHDQIFEIYRDLKEINVEPVVLISGLTTNFIFYDEILTLQKQKHSSQEIAEILNQNPYRVQISLRNLKNFPLEEVRRVLDDLYKLDLSIKRNEIDRFLGFELFLASI